jgi:hypothetical protein
MHFRLCAAPAVIGDRRSIVARSRRSTSFSDGIVALARLAGTVGCDTGDVLIGGDLGQEFGQHGRVAYAAAGELRRPGLQRFLVDPEIDLAPGTAFGTAVLASAPRAVALDTDTPFRFARTGGAHLLDGDQEVQGPCDPRCGMLTARAVWRRQSVLKSGTSLSRPIRPNRLSTNPDVRRSAMLNSTFILKQLKIAASL